MIGGDVMPVAEGGQVTLIQRPWTRVRTPVPIPGDASQAGLAALGPVEFAELIRSNLIPRSDVPGGRSAWEQLWAMLKTDDDLAERTFDVLEDFLDATEQALDSGELDEVEAGRAPKFRARCDEAWKRLDRLEDAGPLAWAGKAGEFQPSARKVIAVLIGAIARHRWTVLRSRHPVTGVDRRLWDVMRQVNLDPEDYQHRSS